MKVSQYNLYFPLRDKYIVYNTLKDTISMVDADLKGYLETARQENVDESVKERLLQCGVLITDDTDEKAILSYQHQLAKYSADFISVLLLPTYACNLSCNYCPSPSQPVFMDSETAKGIFLFLKSLAHSTRLGIVLKLYGGEPLLNVEGCLQVCEALSSFCQGTNLPFLAAAMTNGTLLTQKKTEALLPYLGALHVTLDGSQEYHDAIRHYSNGGGTYQDILDGLSLARDRNMRISLRINTTPHNVDSIRTLLEDLKKHKFDEYNQFEIYFGPIAPMEECKYFRDDASSQKFGEDTLDLVPRAREIVRTSGWKGKIRDIISDLRSFSKPEQCQYGKAYNFVIDPRGTFYTCPGFVGDPTYRMGTLHEDGTAEFTSMYYDIHTRDPMFFECAECAYMPICGGGCPVRAHIRNKTVDTCYCGSIKELTASRMLSYLEYKRPDLFEKEKDGKEKENREGG